MKWNFSSLFWTNCSCVLFLRRISSGLVLDLSGFLIINPIDGILFLKNSWAFQMPSIYISLCPTEQKRFWINVLRDDNFLTEMYARGVAGHDAAAQATGLVGLCVSIKDIMKLISFFSWFEDEEDTKCWFNWRYFKRWSSFMYYCSFAQVHWVVVNTNTCLAHWEKGVGEWERDIHPMLFPHCFIWFERKTHRFHFMSWRLFVMNLFALCLCKQLELSVPA